MLAFYRRLFPYKPFFLWLNQEHGEHGSRLTSREPESMTETYPTLYAPRVRIHAGGINLCPVQQLQQCRGFQEGNLEGESYPFRDRTDLQRSGAYVCYRAM
jgi:hypothetical protein